LNFYHQYKLADLYAMPAGEWQYLMGGMLDVLEPSSTESTEERVTKALRSHAAAAHERARKRRRGF
jgi:hypothetical protein